MYIAALRFGHKDLILFRIMLWLIRLQRSPQMPLIGSPKGLI
jgi:hypothetical protein